MDIKRLNGMNLEFVNLENISLIKPLFNNFLLFPLKAVFSPVKSKELAKFISSISLLKYLLSSNL